MTLYEYSITLETKSPHKYMETYTFGIVRTSINVKKGAFGTLVYVPYGASIVPLRSTMQFSGRKPYHSLETPDAANRIIFIIWQKTKQTGIRNQNKSNNE